MSEAEYKEFLRKARSTVTAEQWDGFVAFVLKQGQQDGLTPQLIAELQEDCRDAGN